MSDNERGELSERVAVLEALLKKHEEGALSRKAEISGELKEITQKLNAQQCAVHNINMINLRGEMEVVRKKEIPELSGRVSEIERKMYMGLGGLAVIMALLKWIIK